MSVIYKIWVVVGIVLLPLSCVRNREPIQPSTQNQLSDLDTITILKSDTLVAAEVGEQLENPYSVTNMQRAFDALLKLKLQAGQIEIDSILVGDIDLTIDSGSIDVISTEIDTNTVAIEVISSDPRIDSIVDKFSNLQTTDLYVRFLPADTVQLDTLYSLDTRNVFSLSDTPLDHEIEVEGDYYKDPTTGTDFTWLYTVVKPDFKFPDGIRYEILEELFIPENSPDYSKLPPSSSNRRILGKQSLITPELEAFSLYLTGNSPEGEFTLPPQNAKRECVLFVCWNTPDAWRPAGRMMVWDDDAGTTTVTRTVITGYEDCGGTVGPDGVGPDRMRCSRPVYGTTSQDLTGRYVPVVGLEVRATRWFKTVRGTTDANGNYRCNGDFNRPARYKFVWGTGSFTVKRNTFLRAKYRGPKRRGNWNQNFGHQGARTVTDEHQYFALIFQAAHDYLHVRPFSGLVVPDRHIKISGQKRSGKSHTKPWVRMLAESSVPSLKAISDAIIKAWGQSSDLVYGTTIHELAHLSHRQMNIPYFTKMLWHGYMSGAKGDKAVIESWATGVEWVFANRRYTTLVSNYNNSGRYGAGYRQNQTIRGGDNEYYTSIVIDMIDNFNQRVLGEPRRRAQLPQDRVSGYTILQVQGGLRRSKAWHEWRTNMRAISNPTSNNVVELFNNWH